jgi:isopenicillin-N N-acyltransferase-like protein
LSQADLLRAGERVGERLDDHSPQLVDELEGIAAGAGQDARELLAINARTELLAGTQAGGECSLIARRSSSGPWLAQTWDWHPALRPAAVLWSVRRASGWFQTVTEAGVVAKLGHNSHGLACGLNFLTCSADGGPEGVPIHAVLRLVLEGCANGDEAEELLSAVHVSASSSVTVAAIDGRRQLFSAELSPGGTRLVEPDDAGWLVHTNHFLRRPPVGTDTQPTAHPDTLVRRNALLAAARCDFTPRCALSQHDDVAPICRHDDPSVKRWADRRATLLAVWAEPAARRLRVAAGEPCQAAFDVVRVPVTED